MLKTIMMITSIIPAYHTQGRPHYHAELSSKQTDIHKRTGIHH